VIGIFIGIIIFIFLKYLSPVLWGSSNEIIGVTGKYRPDNLPNSILNYVSYGLTRINESGDVEPSIASSWETPDNGKTWIFYLNDNAYWQDGKKITSQNLQFKFSDVAIEKPDLNTIIFKLQSPFAPFPQVVSKPVFKKGLLGNGEWKVIKIRVTGNNVEKIIISNKKRERKTFKFYPTEERAKLAFKSGEVNKLVDIFDPKPFDSWKTVNIEKVVDLNKVVTLFFNTSPESKLTSDKSFRQALAYAINKDEFREQRAYGPISPNSWANNPQVKPYDYDQERALELLKSLPKELKDNASLNLVCSPALLSQAEKIAKDWEAVGIKINLQVVSSIPNEFEAFLALFVIPQDPDQYSFWHSSQNTTNTSSYSNPRIDKLLEDGRTQTNKEERKKIYMDFQRFLVEDSPAIFLYHPTSYTIVRK